MEVVDQQSGWPVPLVELRTVHGLRYVTDNAGRIAVDAPELMGRETWFTVIGQGYQRPADGFGYRGVRVVPSPGKTIRVEVERTIIAKRLGRLTGAGLFAESQRLGWELDWPESLVVGCDSVQNAVHRGKLYWAWGDTSLANYPLGLFHMTSATTRLAPLPEPAPPLRVKFDYFRAGNGRPRTVAEMPGEGPTWLTGYVSLSDQAGREHLVASYSKIKPPLEAYETGLCAWNDDAATFEHLRTLWTKSAAAAQPPPMPEGHPAFYRDAAGKSWVLFGNPLPTLRCESNYESWQNPEAWQRLAPQADLTAADGASVHLHSGSIAWNPFRQRWIAVFMQAWGKPSAFGEIWYAEAVDPAGPWGTAVKVLSHDNYTFYNPRIHPELASQDSAVVLFEGTFTQQFADHAEPTPRYDYNQILYRLDLDDPRLAPAQSPAR
ncbi:MAG: hypothetical protein IT424_02140 [Pirellulales bacterium]|nr:hypothetical protein [Pirellulales bacterium]